MYNTRLKRYYSVTTERIINIYVLKSRGYIRTYIFRISFVDLLIESPSNNKSPYTFYTGRFQLIS